MTQQPPPFQDFDFSFDPSIHPLFQHPGLGQHDQSQGPGSLTSSTTSNTNGTASNLFSQSETSNLLGFLDNFDMKGLEIDPALLLGMAGITGTGSGDMGMDHRPPPPPPIATNNLPSNPSHPKSATANSSTNDSHPRAPSRRSSTSATDASSTPTQKAKPLLTSPQKRMNHILSEQKRRNLIRQGYADLTTLLAPEGAPPGTGMPTRGRPKGSGRGRNGSGNGEGTARGKSGILFRAVEYVKWLEEGNRLLKLEVGEVEKASGISA